MFAHVQDLLEAGRIISSIFVDDLHYPTAMTVDSPGFLSPCGHTRDISSLKFCEITGFERLREQEYCRSMDLVLIDLNEGPINIYSQLILVGLLKRHRLPPQGSHASSGRVKESQVSRDVVQS